MTPSQTSTISFGNALSRAGILTLLLAARQSAAFSNPSFRTYGGGCHPKSALSAEGGPQYEKQKGILKKAECVGKGSYLLTIDYEQEEEDDSNENKNENGEALLRYEPGHVLALEIQRPASQDEESSQVYQMTEKTKQDSDNNNGWMRGPYTVSFGYGTDKTTKDGLKVMVKEVGYKSHVFSTSQPGTPVLFGGKFKVPIAEGIRAAAQAQNNEDENENRGPTKKVILVSSGVGVGPCVGAVEELLESSPSSIDSIHLLPSYRTREEICMEPALQALQSSEPKPQFSWNPVITSEEGRLASKGAESLQKHIRCEQGVSVATNTHYHIIGNGQLVSEWKEGLAKAGVPASRVTVEAYFNHSAKPDPSAIDTIAEAILGLEHETSAKAENAQEAAVL